MKYLYCFIIVLSLLSCSEKQKELVKEFVDETHKVINKENIPSVKIGNQIWMKKDLDVTTYRNGDPIPQVTNREQWENLTTGAWCYYENDPKNGEIYGKLYNWYAVNDPRGLAPEGWHVPSSAEWEVLANYLGDSSGGKMKTTGTKEDTGLWYSPNTGATNESGFSAVPGGRRWCGSFSSIGTECVWWSSSTDNKNRNPIWRGVHNESSQFLGMFDSRSDGFSVRCVKD